MGMDATEALRTLRARSADALATAADVSGAARDRAIVAIGVALGLLVHGYHASAHFFRVVWITVLAMLEQVWWRLGMVDVLLVARDVVIDSLVAAARAIYACLAIVIIEVVYVTEVALRSTGVVVTAVPVMIADGVVAAVQCLVYRGHVALVTFAGFVEQVWWRLTLVDRVLILRDSVVDLMSGASSKPRSKPRAIIPAKPNVSTKKKQQAGSAKRAAQMTVAMLRDELGARGLDGTGLKAVLVARLQEALDEDEAGIPDPEPTPRRGGARAAAPVSNVASSLARRGVDAVKFAGASVVIETAYVSEILGGSVTMLTSSALDGILFAVGVVIGLCMRGYHAVQFGVVSTWVSMMGLIEQTWWRLGLVDILLVARDVIIESIFAAGRMVYVSVASVAIEIAYAAEVVIRSIGVLVAGLSSQAIQRIKHQLGAARGNVEATGQTPRAVAIDASRAWDMMVIGGLCIAPALLAAPGMMRQGPGTTRLLASIASVCIFAYVGTKRLVSVVQKLTLKRGMFGYDINKRGTPEGEVKVPEAAGLAPGCVYLVCLSILQCAHLLLGGERAKEWALEHNSAMATIGFAIFLGFVDDVLDLPWRAKMILPAFAALPLLLSYAGSTTILVPRPIRRLLGDDSDLLELGWIYYLYMFLMVIFCSNSINIHAGINGLEAGQSAVIAAAIVLLNVTTIVATGSYDQADPSIRSLSIPDAIHRANMLMKTLGSKSSVALKAVKEAERLMAQNDAGSQMHDAHIFSLCLSAPFLAVTLALMAHNWYPSKVFVGDTFTYFAGMALGVAGILGHFSETLVLFFLPQIVNFLYSSPQLFKIVHCPRHRLPKLDTETGLLHPSMATEKHYNMNLVNLFLRILGPQTERTLCMALLTLQAVCCMAGFGVRMVLSGRWK